MNIPPSTLSRTTKYCTAIKHELQIKGHATNHQLLKALQDNYPGLSATTVHRATARLYERGEIGIAPPDKHGAMRYDAKILAHDHFHCASCDRLRDTDIKDAVAPIIETAVGDCRISGRLTVSGICSGCIQSSGKDKR